MKATQANVRVSIDLPMDSASAFDIILGELRGALNQSGIIFEPGPNGSVTERNFKVGQVLAWKPAERVLLQWCSANWESKEVTELEMTFTPQDGGTRVAIEQQGWGSLLGEGNELAGWFGTEVAAPFMRATAPVAFGDWLTDRRARRPSGANARAIYGNPVYHYPNFRVLLAELSLKPSDHLLEVGCGGGAFLKQALQTGCSAAAVDHSLDMVQLAQEANCEAIAQGKLNVLRADAHHLPFPDATFTCAVMTGVLGFLQKPQLAFEEIHRVLRAGGRFVALGSDPELRGTPAAPEPMDSRLRFYRQEELEALARTARFQEVRAERRSLEQFAREAGVPTDHLPLFAGPGATFLIAQK